jgi:hypothetical protein
MTPEVFALSVWWHWAAVYEAAEVLADPEVGDGCGLGGTVDMAPATTGSAGGQGYPACAGRFDDKNSNQ